jgi:hypothetical protein
LEEFMTDIEMMCRKHFNEPVLVLFELGRLIGFAEDERDYYLIVKYPGESVPRTSYHTAVGGYIFLDALKFQDYRVSSTGLLRDDFLEIDAMLTRKGVPREPEFIVQKLPSTE